MKDNEKDFKDWVDELPPAASRRVYAWKDLPFPTDAGLFRVTEAGQEPREFVASNNLRRVLEGLICHPIYAASYCRISDQVLPLRRDHGIDIECKMYRNDPETGRERYGVYFLKSKVERIDGEVV